MFSTRNRNFLFTTLALGLALTAFALPATAQDEPIKIAVVSLDAVVARSPGGQALQAKLEAFRDAAESEVQALQAEREGIQEQITAGANTLSEDKLAELRTEYEDKTIELRRLSESKQREGQRMQEQGLAEIEKQLEPVFARIRDENDYDLILNRVPGVVVMAGERIDITQQVIEMLNEAGGAAAAAEGGGSR